MRLGVPPTLKQSSLIDSHSLSVGSPSNLNSRGFKKSSKVFKEDDNTQFADQTTLEMMKISSKKENSAVLPIDVITSLKRKKSVDFQEDGKASQASFLKKMPLFNQFQEDQNMSEIRISQIPKKEVDYQEDLNEEQVPTSLSTRLMRKSSSGDLHSSIERNSQNQLKSLKRLKSIDTIHEEESSSPGTSLSGSRKIQGKNQMMSSLKRVNLKSSQSAGQLEPIQEYNRHKNGTVESSGSFSKTNASSSRIAREAQNIKSNHINEMSEVQSEHELSLSNPSEGSCETVHLKVEVGSDSGNENGSNEKIMQKMRELQQSLKMSDQYGLWKKKEAEPSPTSSLRKEDDFKPKEVPVSLKDSDKRLISNINERYQKIKEMKSGKNDEPVSHAPSALKLQSNKKVTFHMDSTLSLQKFTQTQESYIYDKLYDWKGLKETQKDLNQKIQLLERQNARLAKQTTMDVDRIRFLEGMKTKYEQENKFFVEKIKRLQRILEKNQKELEQWKQLAKEGKTQSSKGEKNKKYPNENENNFQWKDKEQRYVKKVTQLEKQLQRANYMIRDLMSHKEQRGSDEQRKLRNDLKYQEHIQKLQYYEESLKRNMQVIKKEQEKIIQEWRLIDQFHSSARSAQVDHFQHEPYQYETVQREDFHFNNISLKGEEENYFMKDNDVASISAKLKSMRSQLAMNLK